MFLVSIILGMFWSLLPACYRRRGSGDFVSARDAILSGASQIVFCLGTLIWRYVIFANHRMWGMPDQVTLGAAEKGGETALMGLGIFIFAEYLIQPLTLLLIYFAVEGLVRVSAATVSGEIVPSLPLQLVALADGWLSRRKHERELGPPVPDIVQKGSGDFSLTIASCRPKPWNTLTTISYNDEMFELVSEQQGEPPRRWVYVLRKRPEHKIVRGLYRYEPGELLEKEPAEEVPN